MKRKLFKKITTNIPFLLLTVFGLLLLFTILWSFFGDYPLIFGISKTVINYILSFYASLLLIGLSLYHLILPRDELNVPIASKRTEFISLLLRTIFSLLILFITTRSFFGDYLLPFDMDKTLIGYICWFFVGFYLLGTNLVEWVLLKNENKFPIVK